MADEPTRNELLARAFFALAASDDGLYAMRLVESEFDLLVAYDALKAGLLPKKPPVVVDPKWKRSNKGPTLT